jgi:molybdate transport system substrate-binding protein
MDMRHQPPPTRMTRAECAVMSVRARRGRFALLYDEDAMKLVVSSISKIVLAATILISGALWAVAADITLLCAGALESWMHEVIPAYHNSSGHGVKATFAVINAITERVRKGESADLAVVSPQQWDDLQKEEKLDPAVRVSIAKVGYGVFAKSGTHRPDIGSVEAFKRALLNAKSIAVFDPTVVGPTAVTSLVSLIDLASNRTCSQNSNIRSVA